MKTQIKIEDFHIGFKYEQFARDSNRYFNQGYIWQPQTYGYNSPRLHKIAKLISDGKIRHAQPAPPPEAKHPLKKLLSKLFSGIVTCCVLASALPYYVCKRRETPPISPPISPITKITIVGCFLLMLTSCDETTILTQKATEWVNTHPKPITVTCNKINLLTNNYYCQFTDSAGLVYYAGEVEGFSPGTIKKASK